MEHKLWLSPSLKQRQNPFFGSSPVYQDLSMGHYCPVKKPLSICRSGWRGIWNVFLEICWVRWGPRTRILVLLTRCYYPGLDYSHLQRRLHVLESKCSLKTLLYIWLPLLYNHHVLVVATQLFFPKKSAIYLTENCKTWKLDNLISSGWGTFSTVYMYYHGLVIKVGFHCTF